MSTTNIIVSKSSDGWTFKIEAAAARQSKLLANMIEDKCSNGEIPIANVTSKILELVIEYCNKHHVDDANYPSSDEELKKWDQQFMQTDQSTIFELILAANYLNIKSLLDLACQTVADMLKGKTPEQIRSEFNIENDYTCEEEEAARKEDLWALCELNDTIIDKKKLTRFNHPQLTRFDHPQLTRFDHPEHGGFLPTLTITWWVRNRLHLVTSLKTMATYL